MECPPLTLNDEVVSTGYVSSSRSGHHHHRPFNEISIIKDFFIGTGECTALFPRVPTAGEAYNTPSESAAVAESMATVTSMSSPSPWPGTLKVSRELKLVKSHPPCISMGVWPRLYIDLIIQVDFDFKLCAIWIGVLSSGRFGYLESLPIWTELDMGVKRPNWR